MGRPATRAPHVASRTAFKHPPTSMRALLPQFAEWMRVVALSEETVKSRGYYALGFIEWAEARGITKATEVSKQVIDRYQRWLYHFRTEGGRPLGFSTQYTRLVAVRVFFRWLSRANHVLYNP